MKSALFIQILLSITYVLLASDKDETKMLEQMYKDIISTIPQSQRNYIDSACKHYTDNASIVRTGDSTTQGQIPQPADEQRNIVKKIYQQIDENREKRIIHFMSADPQTEIK